jgi:hypothetical protein
MSMEYAAQGQAGQALGRIGSGGVIGGPPKPLTLNDRLNRALDRLEVVSQNVELSLCRIHGTPTSQEATINKAATSVRSMAGAVEGCEAIAERLQKLAAMLEQVG